MQKLRVVISGALLLFASAAFAGEGTFHRTLTVNGTVDLEVRSGSGNITVRSGGAGKIEVTGHVRSSYSLFGGNDEEKVNQIVSNPPIEQNGNWVRIGQIHEDWLRNVSISYEVVVPKDTRLKANSGSGELRIEDIDKTVEAHTGSGNVRINRIGEDLDARTGSGDVEAGDIRGNAHVGTGSGNVRLRLAGTGDVRVSAGSGDLTVENVRGGLDAGTGSGSIEVSGTPERSWTLHTGSGEVTLRVGKDAKMNLYARSSSGGVHSDIPITMNGSLERHSVRGTVNGGGPSVEIRTGSGGIEIR